MPNSIRTRIKLSGTPSNHRMIGIVVSQSGYGLGINADAAREFPPR
jgi:hypothetical protein